VPSAARQHEAEPKLGKLSRRDNDRLGVGANDVPLDDTAMPSGLPVLLPDAEGVADSGHRNEESWWVFPGDPPTLAEGTSLRGATDTRVLKRKSGVAIARSFVLGEGEAARRFGVTADGRVVPTDRMVAELGSIFHGVNADKDGLPIAFSLRRGVNAYELGDNATVTRTEDEFEPREAIPLTGRFRTVNRERFFFTRDEQWVRHNDIILIPKRHKFPSFATPEQKWLDVSLANQTLVAWQGHKPIYATLISSGADRLGDPQTEAATIQGVFRVRSKHVVRHVDDREVGQAYSVDSAPWVMEFHEGFSLVGCYWHTRFGEARSFHDIALSPIDAHMIWSWSGPEVPEGWLSRAIPEDAADNLIVYVHK
jgi:hypothetical protein